MDWQNLLYEIFEICLIPLLGIITTYIVKYVNAKTDEIAESQDNELLNKYLYMLDKTITQCVIATNQTYVNELKEMNRFDVFAQKQAFAKTYNEVITILSSEAKVYLENVMGDLTHYITQKIEAEVALQK